MNDNAAFPIDELKQSIEDILTKLKSAEAQLQSLAPIANEEESLEEDSRQEINSTYQDVLDWTNNTADIFATYETQSPTAFELSELNFAKNVLKRLFLVATNIVKLTMDEAQKAIAEMEFQMQLANNISKIENPQQGQG